MATKLAPGVFSVRENGKNGTVELQGQAVVRTIKKMVGKDDVLTIPVKLISGVHHNRRTLGTDTVMVMAGLTTYEWKVANAEEFVGALNDLVCA